MRPVRFVAVMAAMTLALLGFTPVAAQAATSNIGRETIGAEGENLNAGYQVSRLIRTPQVGTITYVSFYVDGGVGGSTGTENLRAHVYGGGASQPVELLGSSATRSLTAGATGRWMAFQLASPVYVGQDWDVWITLQGSGNTVVRVFRGGTATGAWGPAPNITAPPNPYNVGAVAQDRNYTAFATYVEAPAATPTPSPTPSTGVPRGDLPGFRQTLAEDFSTDAAPGIIGTEVAPYTDVADYGDTNKYTRAHNSVSGGLLHMKIEGTTGAVATFGPAATLHTGWLYGRTSIKFKVTGAQHSGAANMIWPSSDRWGDGEVDFPEGDFNRTMQLFQHGVGCTDCSANIAYEDTGKLWTDDWHVADTEWTSTGVKYYMDGVLIHNETTNVPVNNHRHTIQMAPTTAATDTGVLDVDWVAQYAAI